MKIIKGEAVSSSIDDELWRVKVKAEGFWDEPSDPLPVLNEVFISEGDQVLILMEDIYNPIIIGRYPNKNQIDLDKVKRPVVFSARKGDNYITVSISDESLELKTSGGSVIEIKDKVFNKSIEENNIKNDKLVVEAKTELTVKAGTISVKGDSITIEGSTTHSGTAAPTGKGAWCAIPNCLFSGAPHIGDKTV